MGGLTPDPDRRAALSSSGSGDDLFNDGRLGIGVVLDVRPASGSKLTLRAFIQLTLLGSATQSITEKQHPIDLRTSIGEHVHLYVRVVIAQETMLVPVGLAELQHVTRSLQIGQISGLIRGIGNREHDIDRRLSREPWHCSRTNVFDTPHARAQRPPNALLLPRVLRRPFRIRVYEPDRSIGTHGRLQVLRLWLVRHGVQYCRTAQPETRTNASRESSATRQDGVTVPA